jgi:hypothetical protein
MVKSVRAFFVKHEKSVEVPVLILIGTFQIVRMQFVILSVQFKRLDFLGNCEFAIG